MKRILITAVLSLGLSGSAVGAAGEPPAGAWTMAELLAQPLKDMVEVRELGRTKTVSLQLVRVRGAVRPHIHRRHTETITLVGGRGIFVLGDRSIEAGPGDTFLVPPGTVHGFTPLGEEPAAAITTFSPPFDGSDREFAEPQ